MAAGAIWWPTSIQAAAPAFTRLIGTDIFSAMIDAARRKAESWRHRDRIKRWVHPAEELATIDDESVDIVLCIGGLEHMPDRVQAVRQVSRVLKEGGLFDLLTPNPGHCWHSMRAAVACFDDCQRVLRKCSSLPPHSSQLPKARLAIRFASPRPCR